MTKTFKSVNEIQKAREEGKATVFNMVLALKAAQTTPAHATTRGNGELKENILALFKEAKSALAANQVTAALKAGGMDITPKKVSDKLWLMAKSGVLKKSETKGMYELA